MDFEEGKISHNSKNGFSRMEEIITPNKARALIKTVGKKVLLKDMAVCLERLCACAILTAFSTDSG